MEELIFVQNETSTTYQELSSVNSGVEVLVPLNRFESWKNEIAEFSKLGENWDGYGASPVAGEIGEIAEQLLAMFSNDLIDRISDMFPNPHGTLTIEWENRENEKLSLEIGISNYSYFIRYKDNPPYLVNGHDVLHDNKEIASDLGDLFSEEIPKYIL